MRKIFLNLGYVTSHNHKITQIVAIETINDKKTGNDFICDIDPEEKIDNLDPASSYGLTNSFLKNKPLFKDIAEDFLKYIGDSPVFVYSTAQQNILFKELERINHPSLENKFMSMKSVCVRQSRPEESLYSYHLFIKGGACFASNKYDFTFFLKSEERTAVRECNMLVDLWLKFIELRTKAGLPNQFIKPTNS